MKITAINYDKTIEITDKEDLDIFELYNIFDHIALSLGFHQNSINEVYGNSFDEQYAKFLREINCKSIKNH